MSHFNFHVKIALAIKNTFNLKINVARFARNVVKWDFLIDFQTTSVCFVFCSTIRPWRRRRPKSHFRNKLLRFFLPSHNVYARISAHTFLFFECVLWYVMSLHHVNCFLILKSLSRLLSMLNVNSTRSTKGKEENLCNNTQNVNIKSHTNGRLHAKSQWFSVFLLTTVFADVYPTANAKDCKKASCGAQMPPKKTIMVSLTARKIRRNKSQIRKMTFNGKKMRQLGCQKRWFR